MHGTPWINLHGHPWNAATRCPSLVVLTIDDIRPHHCYARAQRLLAEVGQIRDELGRSPDRRPAIELTDAQPRECYFEALATWHKVDRLAAEMGVSTARFEHPSPSLTQIVPGHVLQVIDAVLVQIGAIDQRLQITAGAPEDSVDPGRTPSDVLTTLVSINRDLSRCLERPFAPSDVYRVVSLASSYAARLGGIAPQAAFVPRRQPAHCYQRLSTCHQLVTEAIVKRGHGAMSSRAVPADVLPGDVYDLACLVLGELTFLHALTGSGSSVHTFEPVSSGYRLPAHVDQLARTLEAQLVAIA